jgi:hypothetical protein
VSKGELYLSQDLGELGHVKTVVKNNNIGYTVFPADGVEYFEVRGRLTGEILISDVGRKVLNCPKRDIIRQVGIDK